MVLFRPKIVNTSSQKTGHVEIVRPRLTEASKARWREWVSTLLPMSVRPQLRYSVTMTPAGKMITILGDDSDIDEN